MVLPSRSKNELARALKRARLVRARTREDRTGRAKKNLHIQADRPRRRVLEIEADHLIEAQVAAPAHLPEAGEPGLYFEQAPAVPDIIGIELIRDRWAGPDQRHMPPEHVEELGHLVQTRLPQKGADGREPGILRQFVHGLAVAVRRLRLDAPRDESCDVVSVNRRISRRVHGAKLQACERRPILAESALPEEDGPRRREFDGDSDHKEDGREEEQSRQAAEDIDGSLDDPGRSPRLVSTYEIRIQSRDPESRIIGFPI